MHIVTVFRTGGEYKQEHVERLRKQVAKWAHGIEFRCLTDLDGTLQYGWPGWWNKMEMFRDVREPFLYCDLDTTFIGPLDAVLERRDSTVLSDFNWPHKIQSSIMLVTPQAAAQAWTAFIADPTRHMRECTTRERWGDQGFLEGVWGRDIARWQDVLPYKQVVSWKVHCKRGVPDEARVIISHGKPRPWECGL